MQPIINLKPPKYIAVGMPQLPLTHLHVRAHLFHYQGFRYNISERTEGLQT
jgi:hypothetical protein